MNSPLHNTSTTRRHVIRITIIVGIMLFCQSIFLTRGFYEKDKWETYLDAFKQLNLNYASEIKIDCNQPRVQLESGGVLGNILNSGKGIEICGIKMLDRKYNYILTSFFLEMYFKSNFDFNLNINILLNLILHSLLFLTLIKILRL